MNKNISELQLERLSERFRILILQNSRYESDYDSFFLREINRLSHQMLLIKDYLQRGEREQELNLSKHKLLERSERIT